MQPTSLEAYQEIYQGLGKRQARIFNTLFYGNNALTNAEIAARITWPINTVTPRIFELRQKGLVTKSCTRKCGVTDHKAIAWRVQRYNEIGERQMEMKI